MDSDSFGSDSDDNGWDFQGEEQDLDCTDVQSLFSEKRFADVESTVAFDSENFGFNFSNYRKQASFLLTRFCAEVYMHLPCKKSRSVYVYHSNMASIAENQPS